MTEAWKWTLAFALAMGLTACGGKDGEDGGDDGDEDSSEEDEDGGSGEFGVAQIAAGLDAACALMTDGTVRCWGRNDVGEMGRKKADDDYATPVEIDGVEDAKAIWMGGDSGSSSDMICVLQKGDKVTCWGSKELKPEKSKDSGEKWNETPEEVSHLEGMQGIALGGGTIYVITKDGDVMGWGSPAFNAFGTGEEGSFTQPMTKVPVKGATALAAGQNHACALVDGGAVECWGYVSPKQKPKKISGLKDVEAIAAGSGNSDTCAILKDGKVSCWGEQQEPKAKEDLEDIVQLASRNHFCALSKKGEVYCWGSNDRGQLGNGDKGKTSYKPVKVKGIDNAKHIDVGAQFACAALEDGSAKCWGLNRRGQLGDGTLVDRDEPVSVASIQKEKLPKPKDGTDEVQEAKTKMDWSGLPSECKKPEKLEAKNKHLKGDFDVVSAYAKSQGDGKTVTVDLTNFKLDPEKWDSPRGEQFKLNLRFAKVNIDTKEAKEVDLGEYIFGLDEERKVASTVSYKSGSNTLMRISLDGASPGTVSITHLDDTWVCGELKLKTKESEFTGPYAARFVK